MNGTLIGLGLLAAGLAAPPAWAVSQPGDFCSGNPCVVTGTIVADAGSVVSFGGRSLVFAAGSRVEVGPGALPRILSFIADDITMEPGAEIRGFSDDRAVVTLEATEGAVTLQSVGTTRSEIDVRSAVVDAGNIIIRAATDAIIGGRLTASAQGEDASGGTVEIQADGAISITEQVTTAGSGSFAGGGDFTAIAAGDIVITNKIFADGSDFGGGDVTITSTTGNVTIASLINNNGGDPDGEAGEFNITATVGDLIIAATGELRGKGGAGADDDCGDGALTFFESGGTTTIAGLVALSGGYQCFGGEVDVSAGLDFVQSGNGKIDTATGGGFGAGGPVSIAATRNATLLQIDASAAGFGGDIDVSTGLSIDVLHKLNGRSTGVDGVGARIRLQSCTINVLAPDGELDTRGPFAFPGFGTNDLRISGTGVISGDLYAATENTITYRALPPTVTGTTDPTPIFTQDAGLPECINACGDGNLTAPEVCDDGNISSCDGCAPDCTRLDDVCGDGIVECGEQCDDGNLNPGDGCENNCTPTGQDETGVFIESRGAKVGCQAQWLLQIDDPDTDKKGKPAAKQVCIDGDFRCDSDGQINSSCSFILSPCLNVPDEDLPECDPGRRVNRIILKKPLPGSSKAVDAANASSIVSSLFTLGASVEADGVVLQPGGPVSGTAVCGPALEVDVPFSGKSGKKTFKLRTFNENGQVMKRGQVQLKCERNTSVCGNSLVEPGETCDDGNALACDGCSSCRTEICGNGTVECTEQCDDGVLNGTVGSRCSTECKVLPPDLRIPGGGSKKTDCMHQWSMEIGAGDLLNDKRGIARNKQTCRDGSPYCDLDPTPGNCRVRVFSCLGAENAAIGCLAQGVDRVDIKRPKDTAKKAYELAARATLDAALGGLPFPVAAGEETCTNAMDFDIPQGEKLRLSVKGFGVKRDGDSLRITCE